jgi:sensor histidine kinase regulating citrate/malate metabolism
MRTHFRTKLFVASVAAAAVSLLVAALLLSWEVGDSQRDAIQQRLTDEAHLIADMLAAAPGLQGNDLDREADRLGTAIKARVTLIENNGHVVGDSEQTRR